MTMIRCSRYVLILLIEIQTSICITAAGPGVCMMPCADPWDL